MVLDEGVATPEDVDEMWRIFTSAGVPPFRLMDRVGLDVVLAIEEHYATSATASPKARGGSCASTSIRAGSESRAGAGSTTRRSTTCPAGDRHPLGPDRVEEGD